MEALAIALVLSGTPDIAMAPDRAACLMTPPCLTTRLPAEGATWLESEAFEGPCRTPDDSLWVRQSGHSFDLFVAADGPGGSGRFWTVTLGWAAPEATEPIGRLCLQTSTVGWRTLRELDTLPLPWLSDRDADGRPEVILWNSFPLHEDASLAEYGLAGWVYQVGPERGLCIDWNLSRGLAGELALAYRRELERPEPWLQIQRNEIAACLDRFASGACRAPGEGDWRRDE